MMYGGCSLLRQWQCSSTAVTATPWLSDCRGMQCDERAHANAWHIFTDRKLH